MTFPNPGASRAQNLAAVAAARIELESIIRDAWAIHAQTGDDCDAEIAKTVESDARAMLAMLPAPRPKLKKSNKANKRKAFKHCIRANINAPFMQQARDLVRQ